MPDSNRILSDQALDTLFRSARTHSAWQERDVSDVLIQSVYDLMKLGPTSANCCPARILFLRTTQAKERLRPYLAESNVERTLTAPVVAILANDLKFYEKLPRLYPHKDARAWFLGNKPLIDETAMRNGSMQAAYLILAARALGLDCGPMSGFDRDGVKKEFFADMDVDVNLLCNIGYGDPSGLHPRSPRLSFDEACGVL